MVDDQHNRWAEVERLFHGALEQPTGRRLTWLREQAADTPELLQQVTELLASHEQEDCRVVRAISETAADIGESDQVQGRRLGAYRILRRLGQGGMGAVYLAERDDEEFRQQVAIKLIRGFPGDEALERLRQERQILADLNHPNIARLLDGGSTEDGQPYLVMEYIDGASIVEWCRSNEVDQRSCVELMLEICDAVHYAHQHLVIHRDIKPGNVLVTPDGRPVLLDFGIAKFIAEPGTDTIQTTRYFTPGYASPEQLEGKRITTATDVYSLGRLVLAMLDVDLKEVSTGDEAEPVFRQAAWRRRLPRDLVAIIDQATRQEPARRYATASAMRADLVRLMEGRPVEAAPSSFMYRLGKFVQRHRFAVSMATLAVLIGAGMSWRLVSEYERAREAEMVATTEALRAQQSSQFLVSILSSIEPEYADGADTALMQRVLEDAADRIPVELESQPLIRSDIEYAIGRAYLSIGLTGPAGKHLAMASELARDTPEDPRFLSPERYLAQRDALIGNFDQGMERIDSVLDIVDRILPPDHSIRLDAMHIKANLLILMGDNEAAEPIVQDIIDLSGQATDFFSVNIRLESLRSLAQVYSNTGRFEQSIQLYRQLRREAENWQVPGAKRHIAGALNDHGVALLRQQKYEPSEPLFREALGIQEEYFGASHPILLHVLNNLAGSLRHQGRLDEARPLFERSLTLAIEAYGPEQPPALIVMYNFGNLLRTQGDAVAAVELQREALDGAEAAFPLGHPVHGMFRLGLGQSELAAGHAEAARPLLEEAVTLLTESYGADFYRTVEARESLAEALAELSEAL